MEVRVVAVGRIKERGLREVLDDYYGRLKHYAKVSEVELVDAPAKELVPKFAKAIPERARIVALEVEGQSWTSARLAKYVGQAENDAVSTLAFVIGGSYGLPPEVRKSAHLELSLSAMTYPHRIARVVLAEQIYRAFTILRNEPYDH